MTYLPRVRPRGAPGPKTVLEWRKRGTALHFDVPVFRQANAFSEVFTQPGGALPDLLTGGGVGPCPPDPVTGFSCVLAPSLCFSFDVGNTGELLLIR